MMNSRLIERGNVIAGKPLLKMQFQIYFFELRLTWTVGESDQD